MSPVRAALALWLLSACGEQTIELRPTDAAVADLPDGAGDAAAPDATATPACICLTACVEDRECAASASRCDTELRLCAEPLPTACATLSDCADGQRCVDPVDRTVACE
jgi:hypothetical protein